MAEADLRVLYSQSLRATRMPISSIAEGTQALGTLVDLAGDLSRAYGLRAAIARGEQLLQRAGSEHQKAIIHYFVANAWSNLESVNESRQLAGDWASAEGEHELYHLRRARAASAGAPTALQCQILTNLGNALNRRGRLIDAIEAWDAALALDGSFGMASGNRGVAFEWYARLSYDPGHQAWLIREAHTSLSAAIGDPTLHPSARRGFMIALERIRERVPSAVLQRPTQEYVGEREHSAYEWTYRKWCLQRRLFLNDLNDLECGARAAADVLLLPDFVTTMDEGPTLIGFYNQLKEEYVAARLFLFEGMDNDEVHFADRDVLLLNTLDYPSYSIAAERVKVAYRMAYSLFDKMAFFLNDYFGLGIPERKVSFRTLWHERGEAKRGLRRELLEADNHGLRALFSLARDFFELGTSVYAAEPGAQAMAEMRHELEHKYLKLHEIGPQQPGRSRGSGSPEGDRLAYSVSRREFEQSALRLLQRARSAMIYLVFAIRLEEQRRAEMRSPATINLPVMTDVLADEWKV